MKAKQIEKELIKLETRLMIKAQNIGIVKFGENLGLSKTDISLWHSGKRRWSYKKLITIAKKLEV